MKTLLTKLKIIIRRQARSEIDRHILMAEQDMIAAHTRWQSLLAAKKAGELARANIQSMINSEHERFDFKDTMDSQ